MLCPMCRLECMGGVWRRCFVDPDEYICVSCSCLEGRLRFDCGGQYTRRVVCVPLRDSAYWEDKRVELLDGVALPLRDMVRVIRRKVKRELMPHEQVVPVDPAPSAKRQQQQPELRVRKRWTDDDGEVDEAPGSTPPPGSAALAARPLQANHCGRFEIRREDGRRVWVVYR